MQPTITFLDLEVSESGRILDIGCLNSMGDEYHGNSIGELVKVLKKSDFVCGHNLIHHDIKHLKNHGVDLPWNTIKLIDTLYLSPLLFPNKPYHRLLKDDKLDPENSNNPLNDSQKAKELLGDEILAFTKLPDALQDIFFLLLHAQEEFRSFFEFLQFSRRPGQIGALISKFFASKICDHVHVENLATNNPTVLAYSLSLIQANDRTSIFPPWLIKQFPAVQQCFQILRNSPCVQGCQYCLEKLDPHQALKRWFGYSQFRKFEEIPLQEQAIIAAIKNKSLLTIFPTGGGKSLTFQLPALLSGEAERGLTIIISPLQSLMKDQVDSLESKGIIEAVTINGSLDPVERAKSIERVAEGGANLLYIAPESLRSNTIERLLDGRHISRFVIDEAHCFSTWGQDFRVDYMYIADFIRKLQERKNLNYQIPISCFTATAKQRVIEDIKDYFKTKLGLDLDLFTTKASRSNLRYQVFRLENEVEKYATLRTLLEENNCPTIVYVSRTKKAEAIAEKLVSDGFKAKAYHGKMDTKQRLEHQNLFMANETDIMVATSAFGMGVDKSNIGMVVHYEISDSLENYIQEAGRAGRDEKLTANCYVLYNEDDLNKHFVLLNQTKITIKEIQLVWKAIKELSKTRDKISNSALEIARKAGWDDEVADIESRILTAIAALEDAGYLKRDNNSPRVYATGINSKSANEAIIQINQSTIILGDDKTNAIRIIKKLFASKKTSLLRDKEAESRIDYIADHLGLTKEEVIHIINLLRQENILADSNDLTAFIRRNPKAQDNAISNTEKYFTIESFLLNQLREEPNSFHIKELNEKASQILNENITPSQLKTIFNFWSIQGWIKKDRNQDDSNYYFILPRHSIRALREKLDKRGAIVSTIISYLFEKSQEIKNTDLPEVLIEFSILEIHEHVNKVNPDLSSSFSIKEIEDALFYLSRIESLKVEGGFMVLHNKLTIEKKQTNPYLKYKKEDYKKLEEYYLAKVQQIHIVGEYAERMVQNYDAALRFVDDYFQLNYTSFLHKYFPGIKADDLNLKITKKKFEEIFIGLSLEQTKIVKDNESQYVVVAAGPGSGKTRILVHKLAALLQMEDVKHDQLLMLTFSRAAATEFKTRLHKLIGNAAYFIEIKTFHSYCFDLLGRIGDLEKSDKIIEEALSKIKTNEILINKITKAVLVIDEAQDINRQEFELIKLLVEKNDEMRVLIVGDDDQNIFEWRGSSKECMMWFLREKKAKPYTLLDNYRSNEEIVAFSNTFVKELKSRLKTKPITSKQGVGGIISIVQYSSNHLIAPLVASLLNTSLTGSTCVLTRTNHEAAMIAGVLRKSSYPVKLIQSNDGFPLHNMLELREFSVQLLEMDKELPQIDVEDFERIRADFREKFSNSSRSGLAEQVINQFYALNKTRIYKADWRRYLAESKLEDFYTYDNETIYVSTIHKAKGKEFDNIFLLLNSSNHRSEEDIRLLYVGITRAKRHLSIHYNGSYLNYEGILINYELDTNEYQLPNTLSLMLSFEDVWLSFFINQFRQRKIDEILPGKNLTINLEYNGCSFNGTEVLRFSNAFKSKLSEWSNQGYRLLSAAAQFVVYWKPENEEEVKIILPELILERG
jgi:ATP-dependent DNA helicase RecQ